MDRLAVAGALLAIVGLVAVNWIIVDRTERLRTSILTQSESVRARADSLSLTVIRQAINLQAYLLTGDSSHLEEYSRARAIGDAVVAELAVAAVEFGPVTARTFATAADLRASWQETHDELLREARPRQEALAQVDEERTRVLDLLTVISDLAGVAQLSGAERRATIVQIYRVGAIVTGLMALLALVSVASAYFYRQRLYARSEEARRRAGQLERALRERQEILAIVSHDLRNSLNVVSASLALVREVDLPEEAKARQLRVAERSAVGMSRLISDLLDVATLDSGGLRLDRRRAESGELAVEAVEDWAPEAARRGVSLELVTAEEAAPVLADPGRLLQVLGNLISNAIKFTPEGGGVTVRIGAVDGAVRFQVEDNGPGIPAEHLPRIFDRFYQVRSAGRAGAGLGLAIARGIVEAHGSSLEVETWPGRGTRFWFDLPPAPPPPAPPPPERRAGETAGADHSRVATRFANPTSNGPTASAG